MFLKLESSMIFMVLGDIQFLTRVGCILILNLFRVLIQLDGESKSIN
jgi:hypothetical protein